MSALKAQKADQDAENAEALKEDMIAQAMYEMAMEQSATVREVVIWDDNSELLRERVEDFPATSQKFGRELSAISEILSEVGINIDRTRRGGSKRYIRITYTPDTEPEQIADVKSPTPEAASDKSLSQRILPGVYTQQKKSQFEKRPKRRQPMSGVSITSWASISSLIRAGLISGISPNNNSPLCDLDLLIKGDTVKNECQLGRCSKCL